MPKLLIFGADGFIGGRLAQAAQAHGWQVTAATRAGEVVLPGAQCAACDVTAPAEVEALVRAARPSAVANLAASANIDRAELEREAAYRVNVQAAVSIAESAARHGARLVHFSSDAVFAGTQARYSEDDPPDPLNYYGYTKAAADQQVLALPGPAAILRISLALGFPLKRGNSFLSVLRLRLGQGEPVYAPEDEVRTPIDIVTLCAAALALAANDFHGLLNIGAVESIDRYALTTRLAGLMGFSTGLVRRAGPPLPGRAPRHRNGVLAVEKIQTVLRMPMPTLADMLAGAMQDRPPGKGP